MDQLVPAPPRTSELLKVKLSKLNPHPSQPRIEYDPEILEGMRRAIQANEVDGQKQFPMDMAITVRETMNGHVIISGHTRVEAAKKEGLAWVWAIPKLYKSDEDAAIDVVLTNNQKALHLAEVGRHAKWMLTHAGMKYTDYSARTGISYNVLKMAVRTYELCETYQDFFQNIKEIPPTTLIKIDKIEIADKPSVTERLRFEALQLTLECMPTGTMLERIVKLINQGMMVGEAFERVYSNRAADDVVVIQKPTYLEEWTNNGAGNHTYQTVEKAEKAVKSATKDMAAAAELIDKQTQRIQELEAENQELRQELQSLKQELEELRELSGLDDE